MFHTVYFMLLLVGLYSCNNVTDSNTATNIVTSSVNKTASLEPRNSTAHNLFNNTRSSLETKNSTNNNLFNNSRSAETATVGLIFSGEIGVEDNKTVNLTSGNVHNSTEVEENPAGFGVFSYFKSIFKTKSAIGENCTVQEDCDVGDTLCLEGICQCVEDYVAALDRRHCLRSVKALGDECIQDAQCSAGLNLHDGDVLCISFRCVCGTDTIYRNGTCLRNIYIGDSCKSDNDCLTVNSHCVQGVCACPPNMIPGADNKQCLLALKTLDNANCTEDEQCQQFMGDNALCSENQCQCKPRTHFNSTMCVTDLRLGESCFLSRDCHTSQSVDIKNQRQCISGTCACPAGFKEVADEDICASAANYVINRFVIVYTMLLLIITKVYS